MTPYLMWGGLPTVANPPQTGFFDPAAHGLTAFLCTHGIERCLFTRAAASGSANTVAARNISKVAVRHTRANQDNCSVTLNRLGLVPLPPRARRCGRGAVADWKSIAAAV